MPKCVGVQTTMATLVAAGVPIDAIGLQAGETVVVPTMTFAATAEVVRYFNAKPLLELDLRLGEGTARC